MDSEPPSTPIVPTTPAIQGWRAGLNRNVVVLGIVSLLTDISTEMLMPVRFVFLVRWLGTPLGIAALIEGLIESLSSLLKVAIGRRTDRVNQRTPMILAGYTLSNLAKPALGLLLIDRTGKAIRGAPRDALIADSVPARYRGKAFGFHRSMDTLGAAIGPLLTVGILSQTNGNLAAIFRWTAIPGILAILVIPLFLRETRRAQPAGDAQPGAATTQVSSAPLGRRFWIFTLIWTLFSLGNSSDSFIFLRTLDLDSYLVRIPLYYFGFNVVYAVFATPLGTLSDRIGRLPLLIMSAWIFALVYAGWGSATQSWHLLVLFLLYGLYYAATEGIARAFVADLIPAGRRGIALGWFTGLTGVAALPANLVGAYLWTHVGQRAPFYYGAALATAAAILLILFGHQLERPGSTGSPEA